MYINFLQNNFSNGELSPSVWGRVDRPFYKNGLEICKNFIPKMTGSMMFRPGTEFSLHTRLNQSAFGAPFRFNIEQSYSLEFTDYKLRIHHDGGVILEDSLTLTDITQADPGVFTIASHGLSDGDEVYIDEVVGPTELNRRFFLVVYIDADTFSLTDQDGNAIDTSGLASYDSGGTVSRVYEIDSPYTAAEVETLKYNGTADLMYLYHPNHEPRVLIRSGATSWSIATYTRYSSEWSISGITKASPGVVTTTEAHGLVTGDRIYLSQIVGMTELNKQEYLVVYVSATTFSLKTLAGVAVDTSAYTTYSSGGKVAIVRDAALAITGVTQADPGVITIAGHGLSTYDKIYIDSVVGMTELNGNFYWVKKIDANSFSLTDELGNDIDTSGFTAWSSAGSVYLIHGLFTKIGDFPGAGGFYGGRAIVGGTNNDPDVMWLSRGPDSETGESEYDDFSIGTMDTDGMVFILSSQNLQAHRIYWFSGTSEFLVVGTSSGLYKVNGGTDGAAITPSAIFSIAVSNVGVADMMPLLIDSSIFYMEANQRTLLSFGYSLLDDDYKAFDKNLLADEITEGGIKQLAFARGRPNIIYAIRNDGVPLSCTILESTDDVAGWARLPLGGSGKALSVVTEPQSTGFDRVGFIVERTIDSHTRRYIEYLSEDPVIPDFSDYFTDEDSEADDREQFEKIVFELQKKFVRLDSALIRDTTQLTTLTLGAVSGTEITATAGVSVFTSADVGQFIFAKFVDGTEAGIAEIVEYVSGTVVKVNILETFSSLTFASGGWYLTDQTITGLEAFEGATLGVLTDGGVHSDVEVSDGQITLDYPSRYVILGFRYTGIGRSLDFEISGLSTSAQSRLKTVEKLFIKLRNSAGGKFGVHQKGLYKVVELMYRRSGGSYYDRPPLLYSGLKEVPLVNNEYKNEKHFYFMQDQPLPFELLAVIPAMDVGEEE